MDTERESASGLRPRAPRKNWKRVRAKGLCGVVAILFGCGHPDVPVWSSPPSVGSEPPPPRPPGVALDPPFSFPNPEASATSERRWVVLSAQADVGRARAVVKRFFTAALNEDYGALTALLEDRASVITDRTGRRVSAFAWWQQRFSQLEYQKLGGLLVYRDQRLEVYRTEDVAGLAANRRVAIQPSGTGLLLRAPIETSRVGRQRMFGDEIWFVIRPGPQGYRIAQMQEYLELP